MKNFKKSSVSRIAYCVVRIASCVLRTTHYALRTTHDARRIVCIIFCLLSFSAYAGEYDSEIVRHQQMIAKNPGDFDAAYQLGNYLAWDARYDEALAVFQDILTKEPKYEDAAIGMARVLGWKGDQSGAALKYEEILAKNPKNFEAYQGLGNLALWNSDFQKSIAYFEKALAINSKDIVSIKGSGRAWLGMGDRRRAEEFFTKAQMFELKHTPLTTVIGLVGGVFLLFLLLFEIARRWKRRLKEKFLRMELQMIRYAISVFHLKAGKYPLALEKLSDETLLKNLHRGDRGYFVDPFGKRYWYNPDTGGVHSTGKGYEEW
ncbi:MAG: hypothetical protein HY877_02495 [Deltaproteobacteria bacterium]|nr:hypothetical protein [Deltaproteobacteria bacterium]